jgi:hypothetical protein
MILIMINTAGATTKNDHGLPKGNTKARRMARMYEGLVRISIHRRLEFACSSAIMNASAG